MDHRTRTDKIIERTALALTGLGFVAIVILASIATLGLYH